MVGVAGLEEEDAAAAVGDEAGGGDAAGGAAADDDVVVFLGHGVRVSAGCETGGFRHAKLWPSV